jgi:transposase
MVGRTETQSEYATQVVGVAPLVQGILDQLGVTAAIDQALSHQPAIGTTYGTLAQALIINRMTFNPQPVYHLADWAQRHGIDRLLGIEAGWLDDDRVGALLEALATRQVTIWTAVLEQAVQQYQVGLDELHDDTTSIYFEGAYEDQQGQPKGGEAARIPRLVEGYNKDGKRKKVQLVLSLLTGGPTGRVPLWYHPWNGNQSPEATKDEPVYVADLSALRQALLLPEHALLIGDRKLCTEATLLTCCRQGQRFLAPHPWTATAKAVWQATSAALAAGQLSWASVDYASRNDARKPAGQRPEQRVCEVERALLDRATGELFPLRWIFTRSSRKAAQDAARRAKRLAAGEQALTRLAGLLGKYQYKRRATIEARLEQTLRKIQAQPYLAWSLAGTDQDQAWRLTWQVRQAALDEAARFDGVALLCTNMPADRLPAGEAVGKYKGQIGVEQTIDFLKSPVQIRPMWLHSPKRLAGLTLLIMLAVLVAALVEHQVRQWIATTGERLRGLMPEGRDTATPTAKALLRAFADYALVLVYHPSGAEDVHYPKLRPVQQRIWNIMGLPPPGSLYPAGGGSGK